jgi:hypothetical protein
MLFGRLRVPLDREPSCGGEVRTPSGVHEIPTPRGETPRRPLSLVPPPPDPREDEYAGLDRLDREELDE